MMLAVGPFQVILILIFPVGLFFFGFFIGKKVGFNKGIKEIRKSDNL